MGKEIVKVMKYELRYIDGCGDFYEMQHQVWDIQRQVREMLNKTIQESYLWDYRCRVHKEQTGNKLDEKEELGDKLDNYIYHRIRKDHPSVSSTCCNAAVRQARKKYKDAWKDIQSGQTTLPSYKADQPIPLHNRDNIKFQHDPEEGNIVVLTLFSDDYKKQTGYQNLRFGIRAHDSTQKSILEKVCSGEYGHGQCQLIYEKKKWFLLLNYNPPKKDGFLLDPDKTLGIDMGVAYAVYCSSRDCRGTFTIPGDEVIEYAKKLEARKYAKQKQARYCGEGRIGHGTRTRVSYVYKEEDAIANFRDTINHRYSKAVVEYAVKNGFGRIQMEELKGVKEDTGFPKRLLHWTYFDLQTKIVNKAKEYGIEVVKIEPAYTSQRCSRCGNIDKANRPSQAEFRCTECGFECNADYNASQNISIPGIDKIIKKALQKKKKCEPEADN